MSRGGAEDTGARGPILVVGLGSPHGDDRLGWAAVDRLPAGIVAVKAAGGLDLLDWLAGQDELVIIDAAVPAGRPGTVRSFVWPRDDLGACSGLSTHGPGLVEALQLAEALGRLPRLVRIETVEAQQTSPCAPLSEAALRGLDQLVASLLGRLGVAEEVTCTKPR